MSVVMGREAIRAMRGRLWSPGRPSGARREDRVRFWEAVAGGVSSEDAAGVAGVSPAVGLDGSARLVGCRRSLWVRCRGVICLLRSGKRSPFFMRRVWGCGRSAVALVVAHRRSHVGCGATPQPVAGALSIGPRQRSGTPRGVPAARRWRSWPPTTSFATTWRIVLVGSSLDRTASRCQDPKCAGRVAVTGPERIDGGQARGVLSRSRTGSGSSSLIMSP